MEKIKQIFNEWVRPFWLYVLIAALALALLAFLLSKHSFEIPFLGKSKKTNVEETEGSGIVRVSENGDSLTKESKQAEPNSLVVNWTSSSGTILHRLAEVNDSRVLYFSDTTIIVSKDDAVFSQFKVGDIVFISVSDGKTSAKLLGENKTYFCGPSDAVCKTKNTASGSDPKKQNASSKKTKASSGSGSYTKGMSLKDWEALPESEKEKYRLASRKIAEQNSQKSLR